MPVCAPTRTSVACLTVPSAVDPPSGERAGAGAATTYGPQHLGTDAGGPGDGLLGLPGSMAGGAVRLPFRSWSAPPEALVRVYAELAGSAATGVGGSNGPVHDGPTTSALVLAIGARTIGRGRGPGRGFPPRRRRRAERLTAGPVPAPAPRSGALDAVAQTGDTGNSASRFAWELASPNDPDIAPLAHRLLHAISERARWRKELLAAKDRAAQGDDGDVSATGGHGSDHGED
jgi:hypothetical protein